MQSEKEYQQWIKDFYKGNFLVKGWDGRKQEVLALVKGSKDEASKLLDQAGELISKEWAKENGVRKLDNSDLMRWGNQMKDAGKTSDEALVKKMEEIIAEVKKLLGE